jgi:hypothetical protein
MAEEDIEDTGWRDTESEGVKLKKFETDFLWIKYSKRGVNTSGFAAIPAGVRTPKGKFMGINKYADFCVSVILIKHILRRFKTTKLLS